MKLEKELIAPCGLYCGVCAVLIAYRDHNQKFKERLGAVYECSPEQIACKGCLSGMRFKHCEACAIRSCTIKRGYEGCHQCDNFPCALIENMTMAVGKKVALRAIPTWRELGTEKWVEQEERRYLCPSCGYKLFRGAKRCRRCGEPVDLD